MSRSHWVVAWVAVLCFLAPSSAFRGGQEARRRPAALRNRPGGHRKGAGRAGHSGFHRYAAQEVVEYLKDCCQIEVVLDSKALGEVGIDTSTPMTKTPQPAAPLGAEPDAPGTRPDLDDPDDVLLITTPEEADNLLSTKVYDVSDLVVCRGEHDELWDDYDTLIDAIHAALAPTSLGYRRRARFHHRRESGQGQGADREPDVLRSLPDRRSARANPRGGQEESRRPVAAANKPLSRKKKPPERGLSREPAAGSVAAERGQARRGRAAADARRPVAAGGMARPAEMPVRPGRAARRDEAACARRTTRSMNAMPADLAARFAERAQADAVAP